MKPEETELRGTQGFFCLLFNKAREERKKALNVAT